MPFRSPRARVSWVIAPLIFISATIYCLRTNEIPKTAFFGGDTWQYQPMAVNFAAGRGLKVGAILPYERYKFDDEIPDDYGERRKILMELGKRGGEYRFFRQPGYPFLLGVLYKFVGVRPDIAMLIQMLTIIGIGSLLPFLSERILGKRGLIAGIPAGFVLSFFAAPAALRILTEALIAFACFLILVTWVMISDRRNWPSGLLFGLTLALGLLVKGSLIFIPPLFLGYMIIRGGRPRVYPWSMIVATMIGFALPLIAYSTWASSKADETVLLSVQGRAVLLDGNNEHAATTGLWNPQWKDDPTSFYSKAIQLNPEQSGGVLVARYYLANPGDLPVAIVKKIEVLGLGKDPLTRVAINWLLALCFVYVAIVAMQDVGAWTRWLLLVGVLTITVAARADTVVSLAGLSMFSLSGLKSHSFRKHVRATWEAPAVMALILVAVNFLLLTVTLFANYRFVWPPFFVLLLGVFYLTLRVIEEIEIFPNLPLLPAQGRKHSATGYVYAAGRRATYRSIAREINSLARYSSSLLYTATSDDRLLFNLLESPDKKFLPPAEDLKSAIDDSENERRLVVLNGVLNNNLDIQALLSGIKPNLGRSDRLLAVLYNPYLRWLYTLLDQIGLRTAPPATTFVTRRSLESLTSLSGFQLIRLRSAANFPPRLLGVGTLLDGLLKIIPLVRHAALVNVALLRPVIPSTKPPSLSVVVPARNEAGNIAAAIERMPRLQGVDIEVIFVEGGSTDDTAAEIRKVVDHYDGPLKLRTFTQQGKGKGNAVRMGFSHATGDLLAILDADLTMPPEMLGRFYEAYREGLGDFVNGNRLLYPMEGEAMRFLNTLGNVFFCKLLAWILESPLGDTLCGTKVVSRIDYERIVRWRQDFGDFDPFGDFELLFSAATMGLGIVEVPVHYRARTYGATNIHRFRHGLMLARMSMIGFVRIKMGLGNRRARVQP